MYNTEWTKQLNESYINNIRNSENNEIVLTEEQLNEHFTNLVIVIESIERTFDIELTEQEIDFIDEQIQLNEFVGVLARLGATAGKRLLGKGMQVAGKASQKGYKAKRAEAITKAREATKELNKDFFAGVPGAKLHDPVTPQFTKKGFLTKLGQKAQIKGKQWSPTFNKPSGEKIGFFGSATRQAGYKGGLDAVKKAGKQTLGALGTLATGAAAGYSLGNALAGPQDRRETKRGGRKVYAGADGEIDTDWETESGYRRPTGIRRPVKEDYVNSISQFTNDIVEKLYEVKLTEKIKNDLHENINQVLIFSEENK